MQPIIGRSGTRCDPIWAAVGQRCLHGSLHVGAMAETAEARQPHRPGPVHLHVQHLDPQPVAGAAPRTLTGPVTRLKFGRPIASTDSPAASRA
jgi:hypothetical protein